jgi:FkbM family methyltransferase
MRLTTFKRLFAILGPMANRRSMHNFLLTAEVTRGFDSSHTVSWSQMGEDIGLNSHFKHRKSGTYIDLGAFHPNRYSNTRLLYQRGWRGVNIDANEDLISNFMVERPEDKNICAAVGYKSEYPLYVMSEGLVTTTIKEFRDQEIAIGRKEIAERLVKGITLRSILDKYFLEERLTLLTIDVEGADYDALNSISFETLEPNRFPEYLLLETAPPVSNSLAFPAVKLAQSVGYIPELILPMATLLIAPDVI